MNNSHHQSLKLQSVLVNDILFSYNLLAKRDILNFEQVIFDWSMKLQQFQHDYIVDLNHYLKGINKSLLAGGTVPKVKRVYLNASLIANEKHHEISLSLAIAPLGIKQEYLISLSELYGTYADVIEMTIDDISAKLQRHIIATSLVSALNTVI